MSEPVIRIATEADLAWLETHDPHHSAGTRARKVAAEEVFLAEVSGERVGLLRLDWLWSLQAFVARVWVAPAHRRRGVGRAFLRHLDAHLGRAGYRTLLSSSQADEAGPQAWHRRMGFVECGILAGHNEGGVGEIFFRRRLGDPLPVPRSPGRSATGDARP
jgi:GNAT superfamily N-acetyltransferase